MASPIPVLRAMGNWFKVFSKEVVLVKLFSV